MENNYGFRLQELNHNTELASNKDGCEDTATSVSEHSNYKQRIDSMFDDGRSQVSDKSRDIANGKSSNSINDLIDDYQDTSDRSVKNNIQEKIEKMFEEISLTGFQKNYSYKNFKNDSRNDGGIRDFKVTYLGNKSLADKSVSLVTLQEPLKQLYLEHRRSNSDSFGNLLIISKEGLKIKLRDDFTLNPFPNIAVWASVKFSFRPNKTGIESAFLPLIKDPDGIDKNTLYRDLRDDEKILIDSLDEENNVPPIFAVVMRNAHKILECHAFICSSSEEAIIIAANLYQALMKKMKRRKDTTSIATDSDTVTYESDKLSVPEIQAKKTPPPVPNRPPRKLSKEKQANEDLIIELKEALEESKKVDARPHRRASIPNNFVKPSSNVRRSASERRNGMSETVDGDILTKVAIPRSRSFLNANGPLTRYSRRNKSGSHSDGEITSPLGFTELFNEFRQNEGLESMDDILDAIIDAEGMSFNDLKPIYKEFLLKLAVTLTKDELFQRSKNIMRRQKKKSRNPNLQKKTFVVSATGLKKVFRKTASRLSKQKHTRPTTLEFTSVVFQSDRKKYETNNTSSTSGSEIKKKEIRRRPSSRRRNKKPDRKMPKMSSASDESDSFFRKNTNNGNESGGHPNRSSSGYFSCSECSYDSENCTCVSADKCYCTMGNPKDDKDKLSVSSCGCDTDSCIDSEKCYCTSKTPDSNGVCQTPHLHQNHKVHNLNCPNYPKGDRSCKKHSPTIIEQLKEQGFAASDSSLSRAASPSTAWRNNEEKVRGPKECLKTSKSLEFLQIRPHRSVSRQQKQDCPPPPSVVQEQRRISNYVEGTRHYCYHGEDVPPSSRRHSRPRRQYSSMRTRTPQLDVPTSRRSKVFSSMRARSHHDDISNHVLFPERNGSVSSSLRFTRRMDVYNSFQSRRQADRSASYVDIINQLQSRFHHRGFTPIPQRPLYSHDGSQIYLSSGGSDNFQKLDYDLFTTSARSETSETVSTGSERKVLVVSARDPKGKVLYMGASSRGENMRDFMKDKNAANASEALAVKKSAEIAALFSEVCSKPKSGRPSTVRGKGHVRTNSYKQSNIENTLGYLP